jgi:hypothetical protein
LSVTAKEIMLAKYPNARPKWISVVATEDEGKAHCEQYWDIMPGRPQLGQEAIGSGRTKEAAWEDAANRIRNAPPP